MSKNQASVKGTVLIKKYPNRRLYNTSISSYVTLEYLSQMVKDGIEFSVIDSKTSKDLTQSILTQIILDKDTKGQNLLTIMFLRHLISFYGDSLQGLVPGYLNYAMHSFARNQEQMRQYMRDSLCETSTFSDLEKMGEKNAAVIDDAIKIFLPFCDSENFGLDIWSRKQSFTNSTSGFFNQFAINV